MNTIFIIGIFLCFFLQFLLLSKKKQSVPDRILAIWMFLFGIHLFSYYLYSLGYWDKYPHLVGVHHPLPLLHGPMLYLYIIFSLRTEQRFSWKIFIHFAPAALAWLYMMKFYFFYSVEQKILVNNGEVEDFGVFMIISLIAFIISGIAYPIVSYRLLKKHHRLINENFAYEESINLNWLKYCIWSIGIIFLVAGVISFLKEGMDFDFGFNPDMIIYSSIILFIFLLGYFGIKQQDIFSDGYIVQASQAESSTAEYKRSGLKEDEAGKYHQDLLELMESKKPFLEPKLTIQMLAAEMGISINHLSQIINQYEEKNFYDFVNEYRVEEFKKRGLDEAYSNFSILAIAFDSGFNSKSSFNQVFKKIVGETPSAYMKKIK